LHKSPQFTLTSFSFSDLINKNEKGTLKLNDEITFLDIQWKGYLNKENELYLFGEKNSTIFRIRLYFYQGDEFDIKEFITGELYQRINKGDYELVALLKITKITQRKAEDRIYDNTFTGEWSWVNDCLSDMNLISSKDNNLESDIETFLESLQIPVHYSKNFREEAYQICSFLRQSFSHLPSFLPFLLSIIIGS
jgi:hypothetical protein